MLRYAIKRMLLLIPIVFIVSIFAFGLVRLMPGSAEMAYLQAAGIPPSDDSIEAASEELGLDRPIYTQYIEWVGNAIHLDFGQSYINNKEVKDEILGAFRNTMQLAGCATLIILMILSLIHI